jgi:WD40 repeat protein
MGFTARKRFLTAAAHRMNSCAISADALTASPKYRISPICISIHPSLTPLPQGDFFASASQDTVKIWDLRRKSPIQSYAAPPSLSFGSIRITPDGRWIATTLESCVKLWDMTAGKQVASMPFTNPVDVVFSPQDFVMAVLEGDGRMRIADLKNFNVVCEMCFNSRYRVPGSRRVLMLRHQEY